MVLIGVLILLVVAVVSVIVFLQGGDTVHIDLHFFTVKTSAGFVFLAGAVALALVVFALSLIWEGLKRARKRRKETKELRQRAAASDQVLNQQSSGQQSAGPLSSSQQSAGSGGATTVAPTRGTAPRDPDHFDSTPRDR